MPGTIPGFLTPSLEAGQVVGSVLPRAPSVDVAGSALAGDLGWRVLAGSAGGQVSPLAAAMATMP